ncbi:MAG: EcsC family protein [bacterium]
MKTPPPPDPNQPDKSLYLVKAKDEIQKWEQEGPGFLSQVGDFILWPAQKAAEFLIPEGAQEAVGHAIQGFLVGLGTASDFTVNREEIYATVKRYCDGKTDLISRLEASDKKACECWAWNVSFGIAEGAGTGALGLPGLAANIPALFTITLRQIQEIAACYGYDTRKPEEQEYMLHILRTGSTGDVKAKVEFLIMLKQIEQILIRVTWKRMSADLASKQISQLSLLAAIRAFAKTLGVQITKRKALQSVPIIGAIVGASFDGAFVNDIGRASYMCYRRRFIQENEKPSKPE